MSVQITITNPSTTKVEELRAVIDMLSAFVGNETRILANVSAPVPIAPDDNPATGHGSPELDADAVKLEALAGPGAAGPTAAEIFGGTPAPNPPAAPSANVQASVAATALNTNPVLDKNGLPWDHRIHASTMTKVADGSWKMRRGVSDDEVTRVETELRQVMGITPHNPMAAFKTSAELGLVAPPAPPSTSPNVSAPTVPAAASVGQNAPITAAATTVIATTAPHSSAPLTFPMLIPKITAAVQSGKLTQAQVLVACQNNGLPSLPMLAARPDLVAAVATALGLS